MPTNPYVLDYDDSSLQSHRKRTATNSAAYLLKHVKPDMTILDVGSGPGTITVDFAYMAPQGKVIGIDIGAEVVEDARKYARARSVPNVSFRQGDIYNLPFEDCTFDLVHAHQVLQHIVDPVAAMSEMRRVTKTTGLIACREGEFATSIAFPKVPEVQETTELFVKTQYAHNCQPFAARELTSYACKAGFKREAITVTTSTHELIEPYDRKSWGDMWADRLLHTFGRHALQDGLVKSQDELERLALGWRTWAAAPDGIWAHINVEILCQKSKMIDHVKHCSSE